MSKNDIHAAVQVWIHEDIGDYQGYSQRDSEARAAIIMARWIMDKLEKEYDKYIKESLGT